GIWFDGYWDQIDVQNKEQKSESRADWHLREIYDLIHKIQPQCLVGNNHHITPFQGEDFQMFEQDVPGENTVGFNFQKISPLPLETCATINNSWGFNLTDTTYKTPAQIVNLLAKSAGNGGNLLLNIGPMPNGEIQPEFKDRIAWMGNWLKTYGESIYNTKGGYIKPQKWGCLTQASNKVYVHPLNPASQTITLENAPFTRIKKAYQLKNKQTLKVVRKDKNWIVPVVQPTAEDPDPVVVLEVNN
ncbi:MAG: alpha-L-fucosidase, partial [Sphingobacteriaceae bacterium]